MIEDSDGNKYEFKDGRWTGENDRVVTLLNERLVFYNESSLVDPDPVGSILIDAAQALNGRVVQRPEINFVTGRVY